MRYRLKDQALQNHLDAITAPFRGAVSFTDALDYTVKCVLARDPDAVEVEVDFGDDMENSSFGMRFKAVFDLADIEKEE